MADKESSDHCQHRFARRYIPAEKRDSNFGVVLAEERRKQQKDAEEKSSTMADYNIFMAMAEKIGHDKRGNTIFKRDEEGNEILVDDDSSVVTDEDVVKHSKKKKVIDDQTAEIAEIFNKWKTAEGIAW